MERDPASPRQVSSLRLDFTPDGDLKVTSQAERGNVRSFFRKVRHSAASTSRSWPAARRVGHGARRASPESRPAAADLSRRACRAQPDPWRETRDARDPSRSRLRSDQSSTWTTTPGLPPAAACLCSAMTSCVCGREPAPPVDPRQRPVDKRTPSSLTAARARAARELPAAPGPRCAEVRARSPGASGGAWSRQAPIRPGPAPARPAAAGKEE